MLSRIGLAVSLACIGTAACGQGAQDPLETCFQMTDGSARLACFDKECSAAMRPLQPATA